MPGGGAALQTPRMLLRKDGLPTIILTDGQTSQPWMVVVCVEVVKMVKVVVVVEAGVAIRIFHHTNNDTITHQYLTL